jgi:hypothetical protein
MEEQGTASHADTRGAAWHFLETHVSRQKRRQACRHLMEGLKDVSSGGRVFTRDEMNGSKSISMTFHARGQGGHCPPCRLFLDIAHGESHGNHLNSTSFFILCREN